MTMVERKNNRTLVPFHALKLYARLLTSGVPTLCVIRGNCVAAGLLLALCHDKLIMEDRPTSKLQMSEALIGMEIFYPYAKMLYHFTPPPVAKSLTLGTLVRPREGLKLNIVQALFTDDKAMESLISDYETKYAKIGNFRDNFRVSKMNLNSEVLKVISMPHLHNFASVYTMESQNELQEKKKFAKL